MHPSEPGRSRLPLRLRYQLAALTFCRMVLSTAHRMVYPFLPTFARGLGVPLESLTLLVTARFLVVFGSPLLAGFSDRRGRRAAMLVGMLLFTAAMALVAFSPTYPALFAGLLLALFAKVLFDPSTQAFVGERVPYPRRGLAIALSELSWSSVYLIAIPILGWLIARYGWNAPFPLLAVLGGGSALLVFLTISAPGPSLARDKSGVRPAVSTSAAHRIGQPRRLAFLRALRAQPSALAMLAIAFSVSMANESIIIVYGIWMETAFGLQVAALAAATAVIGFSELTGEGLVALLSDRLGKRTALLGGLALNAAACLALPLLAWDLAPALVGLFLYYITFEYTVVAFIPLLTEQMPEARATFLAANASIHAGGRALGALLGPWLFERGFFWNGLAGVVLNLVGLALLWALVQEAGDLHGPRTADRRPRSAVVGLRSEESDGH